MRATHTFIRSLALLIPSLLDLVTGFQFALTSKAHHKFFPVAGEKFVEKISETATKNNLKGPKNNM